MIDKSFALDKFDIQILSILQQDNSVPQRQIGQTVNLSAAAVQRRIRRMQDTGIISANVAVINSEKLGGRITLLVEITLESEQADLIDEAKQAFSAAAEVQQCYYVTGEIDFLLIITISSMPAYELLTRKLFFSNYNIKRFSTFVVMDSVKTGLKIVL